MHWAVYCTLHWRVHGSTRRGGRSAHAGYVYIHVIHVPRTRDPVATAVQLTKGGRPRRRRDRWRQGIRKVSSCMTSTRWWLLHARLVLCTLLSSVVVEAQTFCTREVNWCSHNSACQCEDNADGRFEKVTLTRDDGGGDCWACWCSAGYTKGDFGGWCYACPHGQYTSTSSSQPRDCIECPAGKYQVSEASTSCTDCAAGWWNPDTRAIGYASRYNNAIHCRQCESGRASRRSGRTSRCDSCTPGKYSRHEATICTTCPSGEYSGYAASSCETCPSESSTPHQKEMCPPPPPPPESASLLAPVLAATGALQEQPQV